MFNSLCGTITAKFPRTVHLETGGVEWEILVPDSSLDVFPRVGESARVFTWLYHREDQMSLFGFPVPEDRLLFLDLLKVDGVGAKAALKIMSSISAEQLRSAIDNEELGKLEAVSGIGKKTAQKMMLALKGKLTFPQSAKSADTKPWQDIIFALTDMGYDKRETESVVSRVAQEITEESASLGREAKEELILRRAITEMAR